MHFWIDKPAGRNYGFGGRNFPCTSYAPKIKTCQRGRLGGGIGPMVTPVHRFQSLNGPSAPVHSGIPGPSATTRLQQQQHQHQEQQQQQQQPTQQPPTVADDSIHRTDYHHRDHRHFLIRAPRPSFVRNNVTNAAAAAAAAAAAGAGTVASNNNNSSSTSSNNSNERQMLPTETTNNGLNSRSSFFEGHFSEISDTELAGYRLRCGVWITFVLATGFVSVAKFYFGNRDAGLDMLIFCGLLFTLLLSGCFYSTLFRRAQNTHRHHQDHLDDQIATLAATLTIRDETARAGFQVIGPDPQSLHLQMQQQQQQPPPPPPPPPPPYHIAILIPPPNSPEEAPPPSYDKAMNEDSSNQTRVFIFSKDEDN